MYRQRYIQRTVNDVDVNYNSVSFNPDDVVLIAKSFDTNTKTKKGSLVDFMRWILCERVVGDRFKAKEL